MDNIKALDPENPKSRAFVMANCRDAPFSHLVALYVLADALLIRNLKDPIVTLLIEVYCWRDITAPVKELGGRGQSVPDDADEGDENLDDDGQPLEFTTLFWSLNRPTELEDPSKGINLAWETLPHSSPLCKVLVECFCDNVILVEKHLEGRYYHPGFLVAIANTYALRLAKAGNTTCVNDWDLEGEICRFHEHSDRSKCEFAERDVVVRYVED